MSAEQSEGYFSTIGKGLKRLAGLTSPSTSSSKKKDSGGTSPPTTTTPPTNQNSITTTSNRSKSVNEMKKPVQDTNQYETKQQSTNHNPSASNGKSVQQQQQLKVITATACCPKKPNKAKETKERRDCGEDAVFVARNFPQSNSKESRVCAIGIADGVGSYALRGVDPSIMAWALMDGLRGLLENDHTISCIDALTKCYNDIVSNKSVDVGGSTACVVSISSHVDAKGSQYLRLTGANIGDSSFMVIREGKMLYRTVEQTHCFNCPYQLAVPRNDANPLQDDPSKAEVLSKPIELQKGDVVIVATDGLTDNVFDNNVVQIVSKPRQGSDQDVAAKIASDLLKIAYVTSRSREAVTPFSKYAAEYDMKHEGGKVDDVTFVVALIS